MSVKLSDLIKPYEDVEKSGDFSVWCDKLELVAKLQKIEELKTFIPLFLSGPAFAVYKQLANDVQDDYDQLKSELLVAFGTNSFCAYEELQRRVLADDETVDVYLADLRRLVSLVGQKDAEPILRCAFVAGLPADVAIQLKSITAVEKMPLAELVTRARMILSTGSKGSSACATGYTVKPGGVQQNCKTCASKIDGSRDNSKSSRYPKKLIRCYTCQELGHISRVCPQKGNASGGASAPDVPPAASQ